MRRDWQGRVVPLSYDEAIRADSDFWRDYARGLMTSLAPAYRKAGMLEAWEATIRDAADLWIALGEPREADYLNRGLEAFRMNNEDKDVDYCDACRVPEHDVCGQVEGCPCCEAGDGT